MQVYRITLKRYSGTLHASGIEGRWNPAGMPVIYTASSRSLACLENLVHRGDEGLSDLFCAAVIEIPDELGYQTLSPSKLPRKWWEPSSWPRCQALGEAWLTAAKYCVLRVPSAIVAKEYNFLLNPHHPDFASVMLKKTEGFRFVPRLME